MVDLGVVVKYLGLASEAARTNWFGLGCPAFCQQPSLALLLLIAILSFILGCLATTYTFWTFVSLGLPPSGSPIHPLCLVVTHPWLGTFMSVAPPQDGEVIELSCNLGCLRVTISGPADQAADLLHYITRRGSSAAGPATTSEGSFELVALEASGLHHRLRLLPVHLSCAGDQGHH